MNYEETIQYLFTHLPMYQRIGSVAYKKDLTNITLLCQHLNNPQTTFRTIHVGGTNGKGSVSNMLASVLTEAGYKTGLYTSPHLLDFRERIRINGEICSKEFVVEFIDAMKSVIEKIQPSFFEITVAMAFQYFATQLVDVAIIEVGLGGRLDSTNIITPDLSVITNIGLDHQQLLGNTYAQIAFEKAGIIKAGIPVVIGEYHADTFPVFTEKANSVIAHLYLAEQNILVELIEMQAEYLYVHVSINNSLVYPNLVSSLNGKYQLKNIATTIEATELLIQMGYEISEEDVYNGFYHIQQNTGFIGRFQKLSDTPLIYCDCAHNADGLKTLFESVATLDFNKLHIVTGAVNDKDIRSNLMQFPGNAHFYFAKPDIPRGMPAERLKILATEYKLDGNSYNSVEHAFTTSLQNAASNDLILICGSIFVVAEVLQFLQNQKSND